MEELYLLARRTGSRYAVMFIHFTSHQTLNLPFIYRCFLENWRISVHWRSSSSARSVWHQGLSATSAPWRRNEEICSHTWPRLLSHPRTLRSESPLFLQLLVKCKLLKVFIFLLLLLQQRVGVERKSPLYYETLRRLQSERMSTRNLSKQGILAYRNERVAREVLG